jgi:hypothetical protein
MSTTYNTATTLDFDTISCELLRFSSIDSMLELLGLSQDKYNEVGEIMSQFKIDWDNATCDAEGATKEQDLAMDKILEDYSNELLALI